MVDFLLWLPVPSGVLNETATVIYWNKVTGFFTTGLLYNVTSIDLNAKKKCTNALAIQDTSTESIKRKRKGGGFIAVDHNKPDWVLMHDDRKLDDTRVSMVVEAKSPGDWGTVGHL